MIGPNENITDWEVNLFRSIRDIADIKMQNKAWLGLNPKVVSSYSEIISVLYDDFDFERYIMYYNSLKEKDDCLYQLFLDLDQMINNYK